jgi:hypothetical protein
MTRPTSTESTPVCESYAVTTPVIRALTEFAMITCWPIDSCNPAATVSVFEPVVSERVVVDVEV